ncbi:MULTISPECIES: AraC family transcriptional regulator [unclassified Streptomyces]|uniref:AraC family transcriptional regulator n=1 Tax=unclassified Streptomyces TaxID=2593676 RepID=UPI00332181E4
METFRFDSGSLDETEAFLSEAYTPMRIGGRPEDARARVVRREAGGLVSDRLEFGYTMAYDAGRLNRICLVTVHAGSLVDTTGGGERLFGPGETFLLAPPDRPYRGRVRSARYTITMFDPALLAEAAGTGGGFRGPVRLTGQRALDEAARRRLASAVAYVRDEVLGGPGGDAGGLVASSAARHLAAVVLTALPSTVLDDGPAPLDGRDAHSDTLRRAMAFIEENAHRDIGLADIAAAVPVTPRAVQYAFARHAGTTPLAHLRRVRLARAHEELRAADAATTVVAAVAARWGFAHPGRFAAAHRREYGTSPSEVLRGGRRAGPAG